MSIDELESIQVNGTKQWLLFRGEDRTKPVVLFVHGGPGSPLMFFSRAFDSLYLKDFVVVHWDQRGAGKSYDPNTPTDSYNLKQIADDGIKVVQYIKQKLHHKKIILVGHSWGTIVSLRMLRIAPTDFFSYVSVGTVADYAKADQLKYNFLNKTINTTHDIQAMNTLKTLGNPPYKAFHQVMTLSQLLWKFGGIFNRLTPDELSSAVQKNTEYSEIELEQQSVAMEKTYPFYADFLNHYVAQKSATQVQVPITFVHGLHDLATPITLAKLYFKKLSAPAGKKWVDFSESAHFPMYEEPLKFLEVLKQTIAN